MSKYQNDNEVFYRVLLKHNRSLKKPHLTRVWQKWRFSAPQTHLWLIKVWFSASAFVVKIATFGNPENVIGKFKTKLPNDRTIKNKQKMKKIFITTTLIIVLNSIVQAQAERKDSLKADLNKNSLNLSLGPGGIIMLFLPAHVSYERLFQGKIFGSKNSTIVDLGAGFAAHWEGGSPFIINRFGILTGSGLRHFEAKAGMCYFWKGDFQGLFPSASIGYRKQKPGSHFIFRTGIGFPDALYVSWGFSF